MRFTAIVVNSVIKRLFRILCRIDDDALAQIPQRGPLIMLSNHINFLEAPVLATHLQPRPMAALSKVETWENPTMRYLFNLWGGIPIRRGTVDREAFRMVLAALEEGKIVAYAPEGTRSGDGRLLPGHAGIIPLAQRSGAPMLPVVFWGGENFWSNLKRLRRTDFHIAVGKPFFLKTTEKFVAREERQEIVDEIMYQLAQLLPEQYRGVYADLDRATTNHLDFQKLVTQGAETS